MKPKPKLFLRVEKKFFLSRERGERKAVGRSRLGPVPACACACACVWVYGCVSSRKSDTRKRFTCLALRREAWQTHQSKATNDVQVRIRVGVKVAREDHRKENLSWECMRPSKASKASKARQALVKRMKIGSRRAPHSTLGHRRDRMQADCPTQHWGGCIRPCRAPRTPTRWVEPWGGWRERHTRKYPGHGYLGLGECEGT